MLGSIGPTEIILIVLILGPLTLLYFGSRWSAKKSKQLAFALPFRWYYFYTYIRLPSGILVDIATLLALRNVDLVPIGLAILGIQVAVLVGLSKFRRWALNLNILLLLGETFLYYSNLRPRADGSDGSASAITFVIGLLIWFVPNMIYFEKRRQFFAGPDLPGRVGEEEEEATREGSEGQSGEE